MSTVAEIKRAASELSELEHEELLSWLLDREAAWDARIEKDCRWQAGLLGATGSVGDPIEHAPRLARQSMTSKTTPQFWEHYAKLPHEVRLLADKGYKLWLANPAHPSIRFKPIRGKANLYSARVGVHYRALAYKDDDLVVWMWIGHHSEYDALIG